MIVKNICSKSPHDQNINYAIQLFTNNLKTTKGTHSQSDRLIIIALVYKIFNSVSVNGYSTNVVESVIIHIVFCLVIFLRDINTWGFG